MPVYRSASWYGWRLKRRMRRAAVFVIRAGLVTLAAVSLLLLLSVWPEAGDEASRLYALVENRVRPVMEHVADGLGMSRGKSAIRFAEVEEPVIPAVSQDEVPVHRRPNRHVQTPSRTDGSGPTGGGVGTATAKAQETITVYRSDHVEVVFPKSAGDGLRTRVLRGRRSLRGRWSVSGWARAIDGDSIEVNGVEIRLHGIDAPERGQPCRLRGRRWPCDREARQALASQIRDRHVVCEVRSRDSYGRLVATCRVAGRDLNAWMVGKGWAFAYRRYSRAYVDEEARARAARRGVWSGEVVAPWKWRKGQRG